MLHICWMERSFICESSQNWNTGAFFSLDGLMRLNNKHLPCAPAHCCSISISISGLWNISLSKDDWHKYPMSKDRDHLVGQLTTRAQKIHPKSLVRLWKCLILFHHQPTMQHGEVVKIGSLSPNLSISRFLLPMCQIWLGFLPKNPLSGNNWLKIGSSISLYLSIGWVGVNR